MKFGPKLSVHNGITPVQTSLAIEKGHSRQTWLSREDRLCAHCPQNEVDTELHFLTSFQMYDHIRDTFPSDYTEPQSIQKQPQF